MLGQRNWNNVTVRLEHKKTLSKVEKFVNQCKRSEPQPTFRKATSIQVLV